MWRVRLLFERVGWKPFAIGAGIVVLPGVGHMSFVEAPEPYIAGVRTFLQELAG